MRKLPPIVTEDWPRKLIAIIFAALIWYSVHLQMRQSEVIRGVPVSVRLPEKLAILESDQTPTVNVELGGSKRALRAITASNIRIVYSIPEEATPGSFTIHLKPLHVDVPPGIDVSAISPEDLRVTLDRIVQKDNIPVEIKFGGRLPPNMAHKGTLAIPRTVSLTGPEKFLAGITDVKTESIELDENTPPEFELDVPLRPLPRIRIVPEKVKVNVELARTRGTRYFENLPIAVVGDPRSGLAVEKILRPEKGLAEFVVIEGPRDTIDILTASSLRTFVDISDLPGAGTFELPLQVWINAKNCTPANNRPNTVTVQVVRHASASPAEKPASPPAPPKPAAP